MTNLFNYIDRPSPIHDLTGATKLVCLLLWSFAAMSTYDTRLLAVLTVASVVLFRVSRIGLKDVKFILGSGKYALTQEQLFYHLNYFLKYLATIPIVLLFVSTTNPSEFAASLNRLGVRYTVAYSVALALRYIPDIQQEYREISQAQQARGIEMSKKASVIQRLRSASSILIPLILSSMEKIEVVSNAMELRCFGKHKTRTWYMGRPFRAADILSMVCCALLVVLSFWLTWKNGSRFYNPFQ